MHFSAIFGLASFATVMAGFASESFHTGIAVSNGTLTSTQVVNKKRFLRRSVRKSQAQAARLGKRAGTCKKKSSTTEGSNAVVASSTSSPAKTSGGSSTPSCGTNLAVNNVCLGMLPDGGIDDGSKDTMAKLNALVGGQHHVFGQYAQCHSGTLFDGHQLLQVMDDLVESGAIFEPAVMPIGGWKGLTRADNSQAVAICNVMKKFTDKDIEVRLRFAHEINWYLTDGTYSGTIADFKEGWAVVAKACKDIAPKVKMFWTPNEADLATYEAYAPDDMSTVDLIGVDFYPKNDIETAFLAAMKPLHDKYASSSTLFAIGETGLGFDGSPEQKIKWLKSITDAKNDMPHLTSCAWFNYRKDKQNYKVVDPIDSSVTAAYKSFVGL